MSTASTSRITLEFEAGADPIRGAIERADGSRQPFWGWLELIEELRHAADLPELSPKPSEASTEPVPQPDPNAQRSQPHTPTGEQP